MAALFVRKVALNIDSAAEIIAKRYTLSPSELRAVVQHSSVSEIAGALGISMPTVKTHLHRLFATTGSSQQADLVKRMGGFASALNS